MYDESSDEQDWIFFIKIYFDTFEKLVLILTME